MSVQAPVKPLLVLPRTLDVGIALQALKAGRVKGLTLWPEWAWAIDLPGLCAKRVENRGWAPHKYLVGRDWLVAVHAGAHIGGRKGKVALREGLLSVAYMARVSGFTAHWDPATSRLELYDLVSRVSTDTVTTPVVTSAIVGLARIREVFLPGMTPAPDLSQRNGVTGWKVPDAFGWVFDYLALLQPISCVGAQQLWWVEAAHRAVMIEQLQGMQR